MALPVTGGAFLRTFKNFCINPCIAGPTSINMQVRTAKRKGYREKEMKKKKQIKAAKAAAAAKLPPVPPRIRMKISNEKPTVELKKPNPPPDDVYIKKLFNVVKYSFADVINFHKEHHHPTVFNNPEAPINLKLEFNMTAKKSTQFLKPFKGVAHIPNPFPLQGNRQVLVICKPEEADEALAAGATVAGGAKVIEKIKGGVIQPSLYDYLICTNEMKDELIPIRALLKNLMPKAKDDTLTSDFKKAIFRYLHGIQYECFKLPDLDSFGFVKVQIGTIAMSIEQLEENFIAFLDTIVKYRPPREGDFVTWIWCSSPPSPESFPIDLSEYKMLQYDPATFKKSSKGTRNESNETVEEEEVEEQKEKVEAQQ